MVESTFGAGSGCSTAETFALQVTDTSMEPEFAKGAIIIIDPAGVIEDKCYVLATHDNDYIFRQLWVEEGVYTLHALEDGHPVLDIDGVSAISGVIIQRAGTKRSYHKHYV